MWKRKKITASSFNWIIFKRTVLLLYEEVPERLLKTSYWGHLSGSVNSTSNSWSQGLWESTLKNKLTKLKKKKKRQTAKPVLISEKGLPLNTEYLQTAAIQQNISMYIFTHSL